VHVSLIELLRCPASHQESALVVTASRQLERRILDGMLGCPICGANYAIRDGVADFRHGAAAARQSATQEPPNEEAAVRLAAQLDLTETARLVLLFGAYTQLAPALSVMYDARCVALNAARHVERYIAEDASVLRVGVELPFARASFHGAAVDAEHAVSPGLERISELLRPGARLVLPAATALPANVTLLVRDARECVASRAADAGALVQLLRKSR
jgi:uncharacterized protein YbaR (Trm112 family)